jgi:DNA ligase (NAD+)
MRCSFGPRIVSVVALSLVLLGALCFASPVAPEESRIDWLTREVARHDELYFKHASSEISDADYDQLKRELRDLQAMVPEAEEPETGIGDDRTDGFDSAKHALPMLSLNKAYSESELRAFHGRVATALGREVTRFTIEPKYDGLAISVTYRRGELVRAVTRGNGIEGDEVTAAMQRLTTLPTRLNARAVDGDEVPIPEFVELRGEVFMTFDEFTRINEARRKNGEPVFAHPRNVAVGTLKQSRGTEGELEDRKLSVVFYGVGGLEPRALAATTQTELHALIRAWGLPGLEFRVATTYEALRDEVRAMGVQRAGWSFPSDGLVVKVDSVANQEKLGNSASAPRWAMAYKFAAERVATRLRAITIQVGRSGVLTPVAELEPVVLGGATITRASLHNRREISRLDLRIGDAVYVERAGEIIPTVVGVDGSQRPALATPFVFPEHCPECATALTSERNEVAVRCPNSRCAAQVRRRLEHFASKEAMDISGLGPVQIAELVQRGWVTTVADLYRLPRELLLTRGTQLERSTDRLLAAIAHSKERELWRVVHGLGIPRVGAVTAREMARVSGRLDLIITTTESEWREKGLDAAVASSLGAYFADAENVAMVRALIALGVEGGTTSGASLDSGQLAGKVFVFTGTLPNLSRAAAADQVRRAGGIVRDSVSRQTDYLVVGQGGGAKLAQAQAIGVQIIDEDGLSALLQAQR